MIAADPILYVPTALAAHLGADTGLEAGASDHVAAGELADHIADILQAGHIRHRDPLHRAITHLRAWDANSLAATLDPAIAHEWRKTLGHVLAALLDTNDDGHAITTARAIDARERAWRDHLSQAPAH